MNYQRGSIEEVCKNPLHHLPSGIQNELSPHPDEIGAHTKIKNNGMWGRRNTSLLAGILTGLAFVDNNSLSTTAWTSLMTPLQAELLL